MVPFLARDFARFATDAHSWIGKEANLDMIAHERVPALVRAVCALTDHGIIGVAFILFLRSRGPRRFALFGKTALLDARSLDRFAVHIW